MIDALKGLLGSKTFWLTVIGSAVVTALALLLPKAGLAPEMVSQVVGFVAGLFGIKGLQQGLADMGKNSPK